MKHKTFEETIREKAEREELKQLRNLKRNLESQIVFDVSPELMKILLEWDVKDL